MVDGEHVHVYSDWRPGCSLTYRSAASVHTLFHCYDRAPPQTDILPHHDCVRCARVKKTSFFFLQKGGNKYAISACKIK